MDKPDKQLKLFFAHLVSVTSRKPNLGVYAKRLKSTLALIGAIVLIGSLVLYIQGWMVVRKLDPNATQVMGSFIEKTLGSDFAAASTIKIPLSDGITIKNAVHAMKQRAMGHGMKLVDRLKLHKEVTEKTRPYLEVFSFQAPKINPLILGYNWEIATYMPYRIALYQDKGERAWLATMDLGLLIHGAQEFEPDFKSQMIAVKDQLLDIMAAGATGGQ